MIIWKQYPWEAVSYAKTHDSLSMALVIGYNISKGKGESSKREGRLQWDGAEEECEWE
ncbi:unnamed protein product [Prunus brigantina]